MAPSHALNDRLNVCVFPAPDVPGQWIAECLELDLVTQGNDPKQAVEMLDEAVRIMVTASENFPALIQKPMTTLCANSPMRPSGGTFDVGVEIRWEAESSHPTYEVRPSALVLGLRPVTNIIGVSEGD